MISKDKQYRTRDGREVRIYATDGCIGAPVQGAIKIGGEWHLGHWTKEGVYGLYGSPKMDDYSLIEVKPRIRRTFWMNVYPENDIRPYEDKYVADACETLRNVMGVETRRIACVKVEIDCEHGEGL